MWLIKTDPTPAALAEIQIKLKIIMADLTKLQADVTAQNSVIQSAITLLTGLAAQIAALPAEQGAIDALAADVTAQTHALSVAVASNTPGQPATAEQVDKPAAPAPQAATASA